MTADASGKHRLVKDTGYGNWVEMGRRRRGRALAQGADLCHEPRHGALHRLLPDTFPSDLVGMSKDGRTIAALNWQTTKVAVVTVTGQVLLARTPTGWEHENASVYLR